MSVNLGTFADVLEALHHDQLVTVCHKEPGGVFASDVVPVAGAGEVAASYAGNADVWFGVNPVAGPARRNAGRGTEKDVTRLAAVWADLDIKPGGLRDADTARLVIDDLSGVLGVRPIAVIASGHGLQPLWAIDPDEPGAHLGTDAERTRARILLRRWGRLVRAVAERRGGGVDSVFDLPRVLRVPGTTNRKHDVPAPTFAALHQSRPLSMEEMSDRLDEYGAHELPEDCETVGEVQSDSADWEWAPTTCQYVRRMVSSWPSDTPSARHPWLVSQATRLATARRLGCISAEDHAAAYESLGQAFTALCRRPKDTRDPAPGEIADAHAWGRAKAETFDEARARRELGGHTHRPPAPAGGTLHGLVGQLRTWQDLPDPAHVIVSLAVAATANLEAEPVWLLQVAPPSGGKTVTIDLLNPLVAGRLNEVTAAGLLGWSRDKVARPSGVLVRVGARGLVTFGDLSSLLASSDRGGRDQVFALLRRVYDGHVTRDVAPPGRTSGETLSWSGRVTVVAAVTSVIDRYSAHSDSLGPRWVYIRIPDRDTHGKRRAAAMSRVPGRREKADEAQDLAFGLVNNAAEKAPQIEVPEEVAERILDAALVTCWGRASVPRHGYGRREIDGMPVVEEPPRLVRQLHGIAVGLYALGCDDADVVYLTRRVALDSMPADRRLVLEVLSHGEADLSTAAVARAADMHRHVARRQLEELEAIGVVVSTRVGDDDGDEEGDRLPRLWALRGDEGDLVADVLAAQRQEGGRWHEMWESPTPPPLKIKEERSETSEGHRGSPHFVPPPSLAQALA